MCALPFLAQPGQICGVLDMKEVSDVLPPNPFQTPILPPWLVVLLRDQHRMLTFSDVISVVVCHFLQLLTIFVQVGLVIAILQGFFLCQFTTVGLLSG